MPTKQWQEVVSLLSCLAVKQHLGASVTTTSAPRADVFHINGVFLTGVARWGDCLRTAAFETDTGFFPSLSSRLTQEITPPPAPLLEPLYTAGRVNFPLAVSPHAGDFK